MYLGEFSLCVSQAMAPELIARWESEMNFTPQQARAIENIGI